MTLPLGSAILALVLPRNVPTVSVDTGLIHCTGSFLQAREQFVERRPVERDAEVTNALLLVGEQLAGLHLQGELEAVEPDVHPVVARLPRCAAEHIDVELAGGLEVADRQREMEDRFHGRGVHLVSGATDRHHRRNGSTGAQEFVDELRDE